MFKFLFARKGDTVVKQTQREIATRALDDLNAILDGIDPKPSVQIDMATGQIDVTWPDQMPDEALALPAPEKTTAPKAEPEADAKPEEAEAEKAAA